MYKSFQKKILLAVPSSGFQSALIEKFRSKNETEQKPRKAVLPIGKHRFPIRTLRSKILNRIFDRVFSYLSSEIPDQHLHRSFGMGC